MMNVPRSDEKAMNLGRWTFYSNANTADWEWGGGGAQLEIDVMFLFTILFNVFIVERTFVLEDDSPKGLKLGSGNAADASSNEEKGMDLGIDYW